MKILRIFAFLFLLLGINFYGFATTLADTMEVEAVIKSYDSKTATFDLGNGKLYTVAREQVITNLEGLALGKAHASFWLPIKEIEKLIK